MILVLVEHDDGAPTQLSAESLALAAGLGSPVHAVALGPGADRLGSLPAEVVHAGLTSLEAYAPRAWAHALADVVAAESPAAVVGPGSERGNEVMAHLAAMTDLPFAANCLSVTPPESAGAPWTLVRNRWAGSLLEDSEVAADGPALLTAALGAAAPAPVPAAPPPVPAAPPPVHPIDTVPIPTVPDAADLRVAVAEVLQPAGDGVSLADAKVIVSGGRGVGGEEGFALLEELADLLGAAVGCSRVVTSEGWRPHRDQVGQTGTRVSPDLYIACGISGAIQHMVGCKGARRILAINTDPDAPIMSKADYSVVGDLHTVLPAIVAEIRRVRADRAAAVSKSTAP
ncbi:MAG: electron transfer flavoprotein subunit alpha/FixB family protein [Acidimicrobiales bacterium]